jgi:hypothetical protein
MPVQQTFTVLEVDGKPLNPINVRRTTRVFDELVHLDQIIASASSMTVDLEGIAAGYTVYVHMGNSGSVSMDGQLINLNTNGYLLLERVSMAALSLNNAGATTTNRVRVSVLGT